MFNVENQNSQSSHNIPVKPHVPERLFRASPPKSKGHLSALKLQGDSNLETDTTISEKLSNTTNNSRKATAILKLNELNTIRTPK